MARGIIIIVARDAGKSGKVENNLRCADSIFIGDDIRWNYVLYHPADLPGNIKALVIVQREATSLLLEKLEAIPTQKIILVVTGKVLDRSLSGENIRIIHHQSNLDTLNFSEILKNM